MKAIRFHRTFEKHFASRVKNNTKLLAQFDDRFDLFERGERDWPLDDHALTGTMAGKRAFSITGDVRVIYLETATYITLIDVGTHNQVY